MVILITAGHRQQMTVEGEGGGGVLTGLVHIQGCSYRPVKIVFPKFIKNVVVILFEL